MSAYDVLDAICAVCVSMNNQCMCIQCGRPGECPMWTAWREHREIFK